VLPFHARSARAAALVLFGACGAAEPPHEVSVRAASYPPTSTVAVGDSIRLVAEGRATAPFAGFAPPSPVFRWRSSDPRVAVVGAGGTVQARAAGAVTIWVEYGGGRDSIALTVGGARAAAGPAPVTGDAAGR
jgi:hypothetical protein